MFWPGDDLSKADLVDYYSSVAAVMVPHLKDRLLTMERYPDGAEADRFYQKDASSYFPKWITRRTVPKEGGAGTVDHVVCNEPAVLVYLANQACITFHTSLHRADRLDRPDQFVLDLDPSTDDFDVVRRAATSARELLEEIGLTPFVKTSGSRGLHVVTPLRRTSTSNDVRSFARKVAAALEERRPEEVTTEHRKAKRGVRLYLDVMRNSYGAHVAAPYSLRALPHAPVSMPIQWSEVGDPELTPTRYTLRDVVSIVEERGDLWADIRKGARSLSAAAKRLSAIPS